MTRVRDFSNRYVGCAICGKRVTKNNHTGHVRDEHPERLGEPRAGQIVELDDNGIGEPMGQRGGNRRTPAAATNGSTLPAPAPRKRSTRLPPFDADTIVVAVVDQLVDGRGVIPVEHLPAVFAWREATDTFLRAIRNGNGSHP